MNLKNDKYTYRVTWSEEDSEYVGLCLEFPSLSWLDKAPEDALKGIRNTVRKVIKNMQSCGEELPQPYACKKYSGRFVVRIPPEAHRELALRVAESGVSLNRLASLKLIR